MLMTFSAQAQSCAEPETVVHEFRHDWTSLDKFRKCILFGMHR